jgi:hypothetical protein
LVEEHPEIDIAVMIVWIDMLAEDNEESAKSSAGIFQGEKVQQFHDPNRLLGKMIAESSGARNAIAWDVYLFFDKETEWEEDLPAPLDWAHQLEDPWADPDHYAWGEVLPGRLRGIIEKLTRN